MILLKILRVETLWNALEAQKESVIMIIEKRIIYKGTHKIYLWVSKISIITFHKSKISIIAFHKSKISIVHFIKGTFPLLHFIKAKFRLQHFKKAHCSFMLLPGSEGFFDSREFLVIRGSIAIRGLFALSSIIGFSQTLQCQQLRS